MDGSKINTAGAASIQGEAIRSILERVQQVRAEIADRKADEKEIWAEAKGNGYMTRPLRTILKEMSENKDDKAEHDAMVDLYRAAMEGK
jgi:uncharacterized protein (UPF0335 family)